MKDILVLVHDDPGQEARLQAALDLTRSLKGHLTCLDLTVPMFMPADVMFYSETQVIDREPEIVNRSQVRARLEGENVAFTWIDRTDTVSGGVYNSAGMADFIVLSTPTATSFPDMETAVGSTLIYTQKPVIAVPAASPGLRLTGEVMVAWDGSRQAVSALRAAMPLLHHATAVTIVEINDGSLRVPGTEALSFLIQRGVRASLRSDLPMGEKVSTLLLEQIGMLKADYVVMGGFGHARVVELLFGGVTHRMLQESPVPLFLKH